MTHFVVLGKWTQKRIETIKELPRDIQAGTAVFESFGIEIKAMVFTMGRYDLVAVFEAPDAQTVTKALLSWGSKGLLRTETLRGYTGDEISELVKGL